MNKVDKYDDKYICSECSGQNIIEAASLDGGYISECETKCTECDYEGYWAYGYYQN